MEIALDDLAGRIGREFGARPDFAVSLHAGPAAVGHVGLLEGRRLIAAGRAIDVIERVRGYAAAQRGKVAVTQDLLRVAGETAGYAWVTVPADDRGGAPLVVALAPGLTAAGRPSAPAGAA